MQKFSWLDKKAPALWRRLVARAGSPADPQKIRKDAFTLRAFGRALSPSAAVTEILSAIELQGERAVLRYTKILDGFEANSKNIAMTRQEISATAKHVPEDLARAIDSAAETLAQYHRTQTGHPTAWIRRDGVGLLERCHPLKRVGMYIPGGTAPLISTILMCGIPAQLAGVRSLVMATPPGRDGRIHPAMCLAAQKVGVESIFRLGGAVAIAAMAFGMRDHARVDKIVGPGNVFVTEAKRQLFGRVGIDSLAGPSEILIAADETARSEYLAWDLLAHGEHGSGAMAILLTPSSKVARAVEAQISGIVKTQPELHTAMKSVFLIDQVQVSLILEMIEEFAPEHLSLQVANAQAWLPKIQRAGAIFIGSTTPQAIGDYHAGPNHVLPTSGTAGWASALSVRDFQHYTHVVHYGHQGLSKEVPNAVRLAEAENLRAHAQSMRIRMPKRTRGQA
jgi:histidinol dehydrogenase